MSDVIRTHQMRVFGLRVDTAYTSTPTSQLSQAGDEQSDTEKTTTGPCDLVEYLHEAEEFEDVMLTGDDGQNADA